MTGAANNVVDLRARYRTLAVDWAEARDSADDANRIFREHHALYKKLRTSDVGRAAIGGLLDDAETPVRLLAATHSLAWQPDRAERVLEEIEEVGSPYAVDAKWTLRSYRSGNLNLDW